jgi:hypothetical protein
MTTLTAALDSLRGTLPDSEIRALEAIAAELAEATSSPGALRRWEREAARQREQELVAERVMQLMKSRDL